MPQTARPWIIAHRGAAGEAPENTPAAFRLALKQGCDGFELDVHLSKDGEVVVIHDDTVNRTTDGFGAVRDMTVKELKRLDAGRKFHSRYAGERIPLLEEVFDLAPPRLLINVEIKGTLGNRLERKLAELLKRKRRTSSVIVSSFDYRSLHAMKRILPDVRIGLLYDLKLAHHWKLPAVSGVQVYSLHPGLRCLEPGDVAHALRSGLKVFPWTVNDELDMRRAIACRVSGIITDYPGRLRALLPGK